MPEVLGIEADLLNDDRIGSAIDGRPTLTWSFDEQALAAEAATDGSYALLTNLSAEQADAAEVLLRFKGQQVVERRYGDFKGPLAVAPMLLHNNRRIEALISVIALALLVFCLVEREIRNALAGDGKLDGLYAGRPARPTANLIFTALARLRLVPAIGDEPAGVPNRHPSRPTSSTYSRSIQPDLDKSIQPDLDKRRTSTPCAERPG